MGALQQCFGPSAERRVGPGDMGQRRSRAVDQQLANISVWLRSRVPRPAIGPYVRLCSARCGYDDPQSTTVRLEIRCATIVERARSCLDRRTLLSRRGPRQPEQRPRAAMGATGNAPAPAGRPALRQRLSVRRHLPARGVGAALALPHANTEAMQLHLDEISRNVAAGAHAVADLRSAPDGTRRASSTCPTISRRSGFHRAPRS